MKIKQSVYTSVFACALGSLVIPTVFAAQLSGVVVDPTSNPVVGAQVAAFNAAGVITQQITGDKGEFSIYVSPLYENVQLRVTAPGFQTTTAGMGASQIRLSLSPVSDSIRVTGSTLDVLASQQGSSVSVITSQELRERNEVQAVDLMRELPGMVFAQAGPRGSVTDLFVRGGQSTYNLALLNGIPINSFNYGGLFDFGTVPSDLIEEIDVARGPQSAIYGSYAIGSVTNFVTRAPENGPALDVVAEGGTHYENRFAVSGSDLWHNWGIAGSLSSLLDNGPVRNGDYRNQDIFLSAQHRWRTQNLFLFGNFNSNEVGEPGPYGSNPKGLYSGLDLISREKNNTSTYGAHYRYDLTNKLRADIMAGFDLNNSFYVSPYGGSFNKDIRGYAEGRATYTVNKYWALAGGYAFTREESRNSYVEDSNSKGFLLRRDNDGIYLENRVTLLQNRLFINAGVRGEIYQTPMVPANAYGYPPRPLFPARTDTRVNPKISGAWLQDATTRFHASYGTGIRPPGGSDLAFTNNPALKPEHTESYDVGAEKRFLSDRLSVDATWFHNRYRDQIVSLGGSLARLSAYSTDNVANAMAKGVESTAQFRPSSWFSITGNYTWLETSVLSLNGGNGLAQKYFYVGQPILRQPKQSGSVVTNLHYKRVDANVVGYFRGHTLDVEANYGASAGLYRNNGYQNVGVNLNYRVRGNVSVYANLRNALDQRYEEIYGYPAPLLNLVGGIKWSLSRAR